MKAMSCRKRPEVDLLGRLGITRMLAVVMLTAGLGVTGFLTAVSVAGGVTRTTATVSLRETKLGPILVSARGRTLYLFAKDRNGKSACRASCARFWPPLLSNGKPTAGRGVRPLLLGTTKRADGGLQVTYKRHPLYTYALDKRAGQTRGEGSFAFGAKWYAVSANGRAVLKPPTTTTPTTATATTTTTTQPTTTYCPYPPC